MDAIEARRPNSKMNIATRKITGRTSDATIWSYLSSSEVKIITTNGEHPLAYQRI